MWITQHTHRRSRAIKLQSESSSYYGCRSFRLSEFLENRYTKEVRLWGLRTGRLYPQDIPGSKLSRPLGHNETGRIKWMKNQNDPIRNRTRRLVAQCLKQLRHCVPHSIWRTYAFSSSVVDLFFNFPWYFGCNFWGSPWIRSALLCVEKLQSAA